MSSLWQLEWLYVVITAIQLDIQWFIGLVEAMRIPIWRPRRWAAVVSMVTFSVNHSKVTSLDGIWWYLFFLGFWWTFLEIINFPVLIEDVCFHGILGYVYGHLLKFNGFLWVRQPRIVIREDGSTKQRYGSLEENKRLWVIVYVFQEHVCFRFSWVRSNKLYHQLLF